MWLPWCPTWPTWDCWPWPKTSRSITCPSRPIEVLMACIDQHEAALIVPARYMQAQSEDLCEKLAGRTINVHHSFLSGLKGARPLFTGPRLQREADRRLGPLRHQRFGRGPHRWAGAGTRGPRLQPRTAAEHRAQRGIPGPGPVPCAALCVGVPGVRQRAADRGAEVSCEQ